MSSQLPPVAILVSHRVADYEVWKKAFDDHMPTRKEASCLGHDILRADDDPNWVYIYFPATDVGRIEAFLNSADLAGVMKNAGVEGSPTVTLMTPKSGEFIADQKLPAIIVTHVVEDFDKWYASYVDFDEYRKQNGIVGHAVNQELGKPNHVIVYHQANDMDTLRAFVDSTELKETMQRAGVTGPPDIRFVQVAEFADY